MSHNGKIDLLSLQQAVALRNETAYRKVFYYFYEDLVRFSASITHNNYLAEDIVSDVLLKLWTMGEGLTNVQNLKTYLYRSVKNNSLNQLKKEERHTQYLKGTINLEFADPEKVLISKEAVHQIQQAMDALPPKCKMVFTLIRDNNLTYQEAAKIMEISVHTVNRHMQLALHKLQETILFIKNK